MKYKNLEIDDAIINTEFCCNLEICKGACCTIKGTLGAPTDIEEIHVIENIIPDIESYLEQEKSFEIVQRGFYEKYGEKFYLNTLNGNDCVFSVIEKGIAKCAIEKAYLEGKINFKKPLSCDLFPVRYNRLDNYLKYEIIPECESALEYGKIKKIKIFEFVGNAIKRLLGNEPYEIISQIINNK